MAQCWCHGNNRSSECEIRIVVYVVFTPISVSLLSLLLNIIVSIVDHYCLHCLFSCQMCLPLSFAVGVCSYLTFVRTIISSPTE